MRTKFICVKNTNEWREGEIYEASEPYQYSFGNNDLIVVNMYHNNNMISIYNSRILEEGYLIPLAKWREQQIDKILNDE